MRSCYSKELTEINEKAHALNLDAKTRHVAFRFNPLMVVFISDIIALIFPHILDFELMHVSTAHALN